MAIGKSHLTMMTSNLRTVNKANVRSALGLVVCLLLIFIVSNASAQSLRDRITAHPTAEFHFARLVYENAPGSRRALRGWGDAWSTDYAEAEYHPVSYTHLTLPTKRIV